MITLSANVFAEPNATNITITNRGDFTNMSPMIFDVTTSGTVSGLEASDFVVTNGSASNLFEESPGSWSLDVTPTAEGLVIVTIASGAATIDGLDNDAASASTTYDITPPTNQDAIFGSDKLTTSGGQVIYNNAAVTSSVFFAPAGTTTFSTGAIITQGGTVAEVDPPGCVPIAEVVCGTVQQCTPQAEMCVSQPDMCTMDPITMMMTCVPQPDICTPQPDICVTVPDPTCTPMAAVVCGSVDIPVINAPSTPGAYKLFVKDAAGNVSESAATLYVTSETHATYGEILIDDNVLLPGETTNVTFLFLGAVSDFSKEDVDVQLGTLSEVSSSDGNITFTSIFTPTADIVQTGSIMTLDRSLITNGSSAGTGVTGSETYDVHTLSPVISSITRQIPAAAVTSGDEVTFRVTFNVAIDAASFGASDFTLSGAAAADGTIGAGVMVDSKTYDYTVTGLTNSNGTVGVDYTGGLYYIDAGNVISGGDPGGEEIFTITNTIPVFNTSPASSVDQNAEYNYPIEVSSNLNGIGLEVTASNLPSWLTLSQIDTIRTIAGTGSNGTDGAGGPATSADLSPFLRDVEYDHLGNLYIIQRNKHTIRKVDVSGNISVFAGTGSSGFSGDGGQATAATFNFPSSIALDAIGNAYVADDFNYRIRKIATGGTVSTIAGTGVSGFSGDGGLATSAQISQPKGVVIGPDGNLYVLSDLRIRKIDLSTGNISTVVGNGTGAFIADVAATSSGFLMNAFDIDAFGNIYIASTQHAIRKIDASTGLTSTIAGTGTDGFSGDGGAAISAQLDNPNTIAVDDEGNVFIGERENERIRKITKGGIISTIAGNGGLGYSGDGGDATQAMILNPEGLAIGPNGEVVFSDAGNLRVRSIQTNRATLTGTPSQSDVGANSISLTVSNGVESEDQNFTISVVDINDKPFINGASFSATQDVAFEGISSVSDIDGDLVSLNISGLPSWLQTKDTLSSFTFASSGNFTDIIWDGENYLMTNAPLHSIQRVDMLGQNLTTIAGPGVPTSGTDDGIGSAARFNSPVALDINSNGKVYVADNQNHSLREMVKDGNGDYVVTTNPIALAAPLDVLVAPNDDVYISNAGGGIIKKISGGVESTLQDGTASDITFTTPYGLAIDDNDILYVVDNGSHVIYKIEGTTKTLIAGTEGSLGFTDGDGSTAQFDEPTGIWVNGEGTIIIISDNGNDAIRRIDIDGPNTSVTTLDAAQSTPLGILLDPNSGSFLIANFDFASIIQAFPALKLSGTPTSTDVGNNIFSVTSNDGTADFIEPISVFVTNVNDAPEIISTPPTTTIEDATFSYTLEATDIDGDALSYTATTLPDWLTLEEKEHIVSTIAGNGTVTNSGDAGAATEAGIGTPTAIAIDYQGNMYIGHDNYIRKVDTNNIITTIAGDGTAAYTGDGDLAINAQILGIKDLHCGPDGSLYISTIGSILPNYDVIRKISPDGMITTIAGINGNFMSTGDGGPATNASFAGASGIFVNNEGEVFIADQNDGLIRKIGTDGVINTVATSVSGAFDVVEDSNGLLYVVNDSELKSVDENDVKIDLLNGQAQFTAQRIAIDNQGNIYGTTSFSPNTIVNVYNISTGQARIFANTSETFGFSGDGGVASLASFGLIQAVATGLNGDVFILDQASSRVRKLTAQNPVFTGTPLLEDTGDNSIVLQVSDGTLTDDQSFTLTVNSLPEIVNVIGTDGLYGIGDEVVINVQFDEDVVMTGTGTPTITLKTGNNNIGGGLMDQVVPLSGSTSNTLTFTYTVGTGDASSDLAFTSSILELSGNTLKSANGIDAALSFPANGGTGALDFNSDIVIDGVAPSLDIRSISSNNTISNAIAKEGDVITATVEVYETLAADPVIIIGGNAATVTPTSTNFYEVTYTVLSDDADGGINVTFDLQDLAGNSTAANGFLLGMTIDNTLPTLSSVSIVSNNANTGMAKSEDEITLSFTSSEAISTLPNATISGQTVTVIALEVENEEGDEIKLKKRSELSGVGSLFSATYIINDTDDDGLLDFTLDFTDQAGNVGTQVTSTTDGSSVLVDQTSPTVEITSASSVYNAPFEVTFTFSEAVNDFTAGDIVFSVDEGATMEGAISNFSGSGSVYTATVTPPSEGAFEVAAAADVTTDNAGNSNTAAPLFIVEYDLTSPTATISTSSDNPANTAFDILVEVSEGTAAGFTMDDIEVTNGEASNFGGDEDDGFTVTITPSADGNVTVVVAADAFTDRAGNGNSISNTLSIDYDATAPAAEISTTTADPTNTPFDISINFSEDVSGFEESDLTIVNGTSSEFSGSGKSYTAKITPIEESTVTVNIGADAATDAAGNGNTASSQLALIYDLTPPTVLISSSSSGTINESFSVTVTFSEEVIGFEESDLTIANGTSSEFSGSGKSYTAKITPIEESTVSVNIGADAATDAAGNGNTASSQLALTYDLTLPTVSLSSSSGTTNESFDITITFSEEVIGFEETDLTIVNGSSSEFSGSGSTYTAKVTPIMEGEVTVDIGGKVATDAAGNENSASSQLAVTYDTTSPTATLSTSSEMVSEFFEVAIEMSEPVEGFEIDDLTLTNGTASDFSGSGSSYTVTISPEVFGTVTISISAGTLKDLGGNDNLASNQLTVEYVDESATDTTSPTAVISSEFSEVEGPFMISIIFSEVITGLGIDDFQVMNGAIGDLIGSGSSYTAVITPESTGSVTINLIEGGAFDEAGNGNVAAAFSIEAVLSEEVLSAQDLFEVQIFPNPTKDKLQIRGLSPTSEIQILDIQGRLVLRESIGTGLVSVKHLTPGTYLLRMETNGKLVLRRFIKN